MSNKTDIFLEYRSLLFSIAYNMLGRVDAAEDIVQDTFVKWLESKTEEIRHIKAYLVKAVTNRSINYLQSARIKHEEYTGIWLPEPLSYQESNPVHTKIESYHALSIGVLVLLQKLTPNERAIFLLKEIFAYDYSELAEIFDKTEDNCRQLFKRAKDNLGKDARRFEVDLKAHEKILNSFLRAISEGSLEDLIQVLKDDIILIAEGGGGALILNGKRLTAFSKPIYGRDDVSRLLMSIIPKINQHIPDLRREIIIVNGLPSTITYSGNDPRVLVCIEPEGDQIKSIFVQTNPQKLKRFKTSL
ncbi:MAG: sigma-70 family RNA polymerase sigma factor [Niastella sp.]|jgi:RNA polymerase sigma-70 factor (ECF subfamily)|uniref:sigma-70 family RNA polymerase sigma factor n=1 Tax=Niastella sp. TaxID=1869183 RepID=UPI00389A2BB1